MKPSSGNRLAAARSGVYRGPSDAAALRATALKHGYAWHALDLAAVDDKAAFLATCARGLGFPSSFGHNWDALADCLQDFSWQPAAGHVLHFRHAARFIDAAPEDWRVALEVFRETAMYWGERGRTFVALVDDARELPALR